MMKLFYAPYTCSLASHIALENAGAEYTTARIDFAADCDPYLFAMAQWLEQDGVDPSRFPKVIDHRSRMSERPEVRKAIAEQRA
jgi:glutathione S-transferase